MTSPPSPAGPAADYARPPYRAPHTPGPPLRPLDVLLPWRLARVVYGPYSMLRFAPSRMADVLGGGVFGAAGQPVASALAAETLDPWIERLLLPRVLLGFGVVFQAVCLATGAVTANGLLNDAFGDSVVMMLTGPLALLLVCVPLVAIAHPGTRGQVARLVARPLLLGVVTAGVFCGMVLLSRDDTQGGVLGLRALVILWLGVFVPCVLYLVHRNSFAVRAHPLVRPLVAVLLVWLTVLGHVWLVDTKGTSTHGSALVALISGPVGVTATAVVEVVLLRRRHRVGFRGPLARP